MYEQIKQIVEKFESLSNEDQKKVKKILKKYVNGEIKIDDAHYSLVKENLILSVRFKPKDFYC